MNLVCCCQCWSRLIQNTARGQLKMGILWLSNMRAGLLYILLCIQIYLPFPFWALLHPHIFWFQLGRWDSVWLIHIERSAFRLENNMMNCCLQGCLLHRPLCTWPRSNHPRLHWGTHGKVGFSFEVIGKHVMQPIHNDPSIRCLGERWRMVVPPHLAYGDSGAGDSIPGWLTRM